MQTAIQIPIGQMLLQWIEPSIVRNSRKIPAVHPPQPTQYTHTSIHTVSHWVHVTSFVSGPPQLGQLIISPVPSHVGQSGPPSQPLKIVGSTSSPGHGDFS